MKSKGTLIFFCGKMGAGKSTKSKQLALDRNAVLISEDEWLAALYPDQIASFEDYIKFSGRLKPLVKNHVQNILSAETNVVMDFPANTVAQRKWFKAIISEIDAPHELIYLNTSDEICLKQIAKRGIFLEIQKFFPEKIKVIFVSCVSPKNC